MNRVKTVLALFLVLVMNSLNSFADIGGRGRIDSGGPSDITVILLGIVAIVVGGFLCFVFWGASSQDGFKDKDSNKMGCASILAIIIGLLLLIGMCSR